MTHMALYNTLLALLVTPLSAVDAVSPRNSTRWLQNDTALWNFWWSDPMRYLVNRGGITATVLGHYVYLAGGASPPQNESDADQDSDPERPGYSDIVSIDISKSWSESENLSIKVIERSPAALPQSLRHVWADTEAQVLYTWQPEQWWLSSPEDHNRTNNLEVFTPDGQGRGTWSQFHLKNASAPLSVGTDCAITVARGTGFIIGGSDKYWQPLTSVLEFNISDRSIRDDENLLMLNLGASQSLETLEGGSAEYIPTFGEHGLIMLIGGMWHSVSPGVRARPASLQNLTFFDPVTKEVYWQQSTGSIPEAPRVDFCTVGFATADGGYDIFFYGGGDNIDTSSVVHPTAYVLSLPAFRWTQFPFLHEETRWKHACVVVGKSQVLIIGGSSDSPILYPNRTLLFDMTAMEWKYSYNAEAPAYQRAQNIQNWYKTNFSSSIEWSTKAVRKLFTGIPDDDPEPSPDLTETPRAMSPQAIAGIAAGGAVFLALFAALSCFLHRKRQKKRNQHSKQLILSTSSELHGNYITLRYLGQEMHTGSEYFELSSVPRRFPPEMALYQEYFELPCHLSSVHIAANGVVRRWPWRLALAAPPLTADEQSQEADESGPPSPHN
ncbi:hypothetical protein QBC40DRAFT_269827 [Triangularia verruculosa]|uniref:Kelch repeat protein n=1 Tax=Triangularia verruculosa TaxID=2587418 RepID=A0AAN7AQH7_9PEZI|nr:hypothetical protein QBC40DRAFT_269827 [Triangularia verruculosa]